MGFMESDTLTNFCFVGLSMNVGLLQMTAIEHDFKVMTRSETRSGSMKQNFESKKFAHKHEISFKVK